MSPQQTIAHYRITAEFGDGGMGLRLKPAATSSRKVLPDAAILAVKQAYRPLMVFDAAINSGYGR